MSPAPTLHEAAASLYRSCGQFPFYFAKGKLKYDPIMTDLLVLGCLSRKSASAARLLDLGCGQGLLFAMLDASARIAPESKVAASSPAAPPIAFARGFDAARSNVRWGQSMLANRAQPHLDAEIVVADIRTVDLPVCDIVVAIDVLHYMPYADQESLLRKVAAALALGGRLVLLVPRRAAGSARAIPPGLSRAPVTGRVAAAGMGDRHGAVAHGSVLSERPPCRRTGSPVPPCQD